MISHVKSYTGTVTIKTNRLLLRRFSIYEIGYCLGKGYWNKGIMTEALIAVIKHMILVVGMNRVQAKQSKYHLDMEQ